MLNDLGRKGQKVVIVTKKEGQARLSPVDAHISLHIPKPAESGPVTFTRTKERSANANNHIHLDFDASPVFTAGGDDGQSESQSQDD